MGDNDGDDDADDDDDDDDDDGARCTRGSLILRVVGSSVANNIFSAYEREIVNLNSIFI